MDTTIRNLDAKLYRRARARAAAEGKTVGAVVNEALRAHLIEIRPGKGRHHWWEMPTADLGPGTENLSEQIDEILYGKDAV